MVSINPRFRFFDNTGVCPCIDPVLLGRLLDRLDEGKSPTLLSVVVKTLQRLRKKLAQ